MKEYNVLRYGAKGDGRRSVSGLEVSGHTKR